VHSETSRSLGELDYLDSSPQELRKAERTSVLFFGLNGKCTCIVLIDKLEARDIGAYLEKLTVANKMWRQVDLDILLRHTLPEASTLDQRFAYLYLEYE
jgi:hypothetical protein